MKNFLFVVVLLLISCTTIGASSVRPISDSTAIPKFIVDRLTWDGLPESRFIYKDDSFVYYFDENKELVELYIIGNDYVNKVEYLNKVSSLQRDLATSKNFSMLLSIVSAGLLALFMLKIYKII